MKKIFIILLFLVTSKIYGQTLEWVKSVGGSLDDIGTYITTDDSGYVYVTGQFEGTVDFDPGIGVSNLSSFSGADIFVQKLDQNGNFIWAKRIGGSSDQWSTTIHVENGNIYLSGFFQGLTDFDPNGGIVNINTSGQQDVFVLKLDVNGNFNWVKTIGATQADIGNSIITDSGGNVYVTGGFRDTVDFDPGPGVQNLIANAGDFDMFILKLDSNGNYMWANSLGLSSSDFGNSVHVDVNDNVFVTGIYNNKLILEKLDTAGNITWIKSIGVLSSEGYTVTSDAYGNTYLSGYFWGTADFDPGAGVANLTSNGQRDLFVEKFDAQGNYVWAKSVGGVNDDFGVSLSVNSKGDVYTTGYFSGLVDFDPGPGTLNLTANGSEDIFILKLDSSGTFVWADNFGDINQDRGLSVSVNSNDEVYITGWFSGTTNFDLGSGNTSLTSNGFWDVFIMKLGMSTFIKEDYLDLKVEVYPNPATSFVNISCDNEEDCEFSMFNYKGQKVISEVLNSRTNQIDISGLTSGVYFYRIVSDRGIASDKIIVLD